ncbi:MAG: hypothetical protein J5I94_17255 [Phaeodactylibacter sp.]|nr:hypothetical protein [Phaeodactylibacter sp.]
MNVFKKSVAGFVGVEIPEFQACCPEVKQAGKDMAGNVFFDPNRGLSYAVFENKQFIPADHFVPLSIIHFFGELKYNAFATSIWKKAPP